MVSKLLQSLVGCLSPRGRNPNRGKQNRWRTVGSHSNTVTDLPGSRSRNVGPQREHKKPAPRNPDNRVALTIPKHFPKKQTQIYSYKNKIQPWYNIRNTCNIEQAETVAINNRHKTTKNTVCTHSMFYISCPLCLALFLPNKTNTWQPRHIVLSFNCF